MIDPVWVEFGKVAAAHALAVASPGPDFALVLRQSIHHGRRTAVVTSFGIGTAILLHVTYSLLGIGIVIKGSPVAFTVLKYVGAGYLLWLGVRSILASPRDAERPVPASELVAPSWRGAFAAGFLTNALNVKATLFFVALFVTVISPATPKSVQLGYGLWMAVTTAGWFILVSVVFTRAAVRRRFLCYGHWIDRALGLVFIAFGVSLALATARPA